MFAFGIFAYLLESIDTDRKHGKRKRAMTWNKGPQPDLHQAYLTTRPPGCPRNTITFLYSGQTVFLSLTFI